MGATGGRGSDSGEIFQDGFGRFPSSPDAAILFPPAGKVDLMSDITGSRIPSPGPIPQIPPTRPSSPPKGEVAFLDLNAGDPAERLEAFYLMLRTRSYAVTPPQAPTAAWQRLEVLLHAPQEARTWNQAYE